MAKTKKYFVEQVVDDEEETKKEQADTNEGGILKKDSSDSNVQSKVDAPAKAAEPKEPLDKANALTEEITAPADNTEILQKILSKLEDIEARLSMVEGGVEENNEQPEINPEEPKALEEDAVGFEGDNPSGPSLGAKNDVDGGVLKKDVSQPSTKKVEDESEEAVPKEPLDNVQKLNEQLSGRRIVVGGMGTVKEDGASIETIMKEYVKTIGRF